MSICSNDLVVSNSLHSQVIFCQFQLHFVGRLREDREMVDVPGPGAPLCGPKAGASAVAWLLRDATVALELVKCGTSFFWAKSDSSVI